MWRIRFSLGGDGKLNRRCLGVPISRDFEAHSLPQDATRVDMWPSHGCDRNRELAQPPESLSPLGKWRRAERSIPSNREFDFLARIFHVAIDVALFDGFCELGRVGQTAVSRRTGQMATAWRLLGWWVSVADAP